MNPYYHPPIPQQPHYAYGVPASPVPAPWVGYHQPIPMHTYAQNDQLVYQGSGDTFLNTSDSLIHDQIDAFLEQGLTMQDLEVTSEERLTVQELEAIIRDTLTMQEFEAVLDGSYIIQELGANLEGHRVNGGRSGSGLSEEEISKHLHVYTEQGEMIENGEVDVCCICLGDYKEKEKMGRLECGHRFHEECIKRWLLSKNVCPMCRSTALTV